MRLPAFCLAVLTGVCVARAARGGPQATLICVAPDGNDTWSGSLEKPNEEGTDGPFRTIHRAQREARRLNPRRVGPWQIGILIRGRHFLGEPLVIRPEDSGGDRCPVAYFGRGKPLGTVPLRTWVTVAIECGLGSQADGRYRLTLTVPGEKPVERRLACGSARFRRLAWLGLVSLAAEKMAFCLDNLRLNLVDQ